MNNKEDNVNCDKDNKVIMKIIIMTAIMKRKTTNIKRNNLMKKNSKKITK